MPDYRLYFLNDDGHVRHAEELMCSCDEEAIRVAEQYRDGRDMELWQRDRVVKTMPKLQKSYRPPEPSRGAAGSDSSALRSFGLKASSSS